MRPHVEQTIRDLTAEIARLQDTINMLHKIDAGAPQTMDESVRPPTATRSNDVLKKNPVKPKLKQGGGRSSNGRSHQMRELSQHITDAALRLEQPFTAEQLMAAADIDQKKAWAYLWRWKKMYGWVRSLGRNSYERTARFGGGEMKPAKAVPTQARVNVPGLDKESKPLEEQIEEALAERDRQRSAGRENMAKVYQDKADKLQRQLDQE